MRICFITEYFYPDNMGSTGTILSQLARRLKDDYPDVQIDTVTSKHVYRGDVGDLPMFEVWDGIRIFRISAPRTKQDSTVIRLIAGLWFSLLVSTRLLAGPRYDLVFVVTNPPTLPMIAHWVSRARKIPFAYLIHDLFPDVAIGLGHIRKGSKIANIAKSMQRKWLMAAEKVIVLGRCMKGYLAYEYGLPEEKIEVIPNWADPDAIRPMEQNESRFRSEYNLKGFVVLYAGNFGQYQSFDNILGAAKILSERQVDVTFAFVGDGAKKQYIEQFVSENGINNVRMFPFVPQDQLADMLGAANTCLVTLERGMEGLGVPSKMYNILASGRPMVAILNQDAEVARVIDDFDCGVRVDYEDPIMLADAIGDLVTNPARAEQMGANARRALEENYTPDKAVEHFYEVFVSVAGGSKVSR